MIPNLTLATELGNLLKERRLTLCAAESCTGGLLLSTLTDVPGSSAYVLGGVVAYSYEAKEVLVHVQHDTLVTYGAVSAETAREMAAGVRAVFQADIGVSITGIAGPDGGMPGKPVGLVYIGVAIDDAIRVQCHVWSGKRVENKIQSVTQAMKMVVGILEDNR